MCVDRNCTNSTNRVLYVRVVNQTGRAGRTAHVHVYTHMAISLHRFGRYDLIVI